MSSEGGDNEHEVLVINMMMGPCWPDAETTLTYYARWFRTFRRGSVENPKSIAAISKVYWRFEV
jgi:hypothetical protein